MADGGIEGYACVRASGVSGMGTVMGWDGMGWDGMGCACGVIRVTEVGVEVAWGLAGGLGSFGGGVTVVGGG